LGLGLVTFLAATSIAVVGLYFVLWFFSGTPVPDSQKTQERIRRQDTQGTQDPENSQINSPAEKAAGGLGKLLQSARVPVAVPTTPFANLVEHLLGRGSQCPAPFDSFEQCLSQCSSLDLNRPIGLKYWTEEEGVWRMQSVVAFPKTGGRTDSGPTYKALHYSGWNPPANALQREATVLSLAPPEQVAALVEAGADPELRFGDEGNTALIEAVQHRDLPKVKALIAAGASKTGRSAGSGQEPINLIDVTAPEAKSLEESLR